MPWQSLPSSSPDEPKNFGAGLDRVLAQLGSARSETVADVFSQWSSIVGDQVADHTAPISLRNGTLLLAVADPAWAIQLRFLEAELLERIQAEVGEAEVRRIDVVIRAPKGG